MRSQIGIFLKETRTKDGISLRDFSKQLNISHGYLAKLEAGIDPRSGKEVVPALHVLDKIARGLDMPVQTLLLMAKQDLYTPSEDSADITQMVSEFLSGLYTKKHLSLNGKMLDEQQIHSLVKSLQSAFDEVVEMRT